MSIIKRKEKYYCRFQINGERHHYLCSGAANKSQAEQIEAALKYKTMQKQTGILPKTEKNTVKPGALYDLYLEHSRINKKGYLVDVSKVKTLKTYFPCDRTACSIKPQDFEKFKEQIMHDRGITSSTVNRFLFTLSKMFNLGIKADLLETNPIAKVSKFKERNYRIRYLTVEEENRLYKILSKEEYSHILPLVTTALQTGMRRGEIFNLKWSNIDFEYGYIELLETKSGKSRKIPISEKLRDIIDKQPKINEYVFNDKDNRPFKGIYKIFNKILKEADIVHFRFHDLRHTVATRLAGEGIDLVTVKELLGHSVIATTMRYAHATPQRKLAAIDVLNSYQ